MAIATMWAMATATRVANDKEGEGTTTDDNDDNVDDNDDDDDDE
jgi:hypothetical protein